MQLKSCFPSSMFLIHMRVPLKEWLNLEHLTSENQGYIVHTYTYQPFITTAGCIEAERRESCGEMEGRTGANYRIASLVLIKLDAHRAPSFL